MNMRPDGDLGATSTSCITEQVRNCQSLARFKIEFRRNSRTAKYSLESFVDDVAYNNLGLSATRYTHEQGRPPAMAILFWKTCHLCRHDCLLHFVVECLRPLPENIQVGLFQLAAFCSRKVNGRREYVPDLPPVEFIVCMASDPMRYLTLLHGCAFHGGEEFRHHGPLSINIKCRKLDGQMNARQNCSVKRH